MIGQGNLPRSRESKIADPVLPWTPDICVMKSCDDRCTRSHGVPVVARNMAETLQQLSEEKHGRLPEGYPIAWGLS